MTFDEFLEETQPDADTTQQALRLYLSEVTDDLAPDEMREILGREAVDPAALAEELRVLERDSHVMEQAALAYFDAAWEDSAQRAAIRASFEHARTKMPVIEVGLIALSAMYGMHLLATRGVVSEHEEETVRAGKTIQRTRSVKRESFAPIAAIIGRLFRRR